MVACFVIVSLLLLRRLPRDSQGLSYRRANRYKGILLRRGGSEHPVVGNGDRQPRVGIRPTDRSTSPRSVWMCNAIAVTALVTENTGKSVSASTFLPVFASARPPQTSTTCLPST